jgi:hypothetical protein
MTDSRFLIVLVLIVSIAAGVLIHQFVTDALKPRPYK